MSKIIEIIAPGFYANLTNKQRKYVEHTFQKYGYKTKWSANAARKTVQLSVKQFMAKDAERLNDLMNAFKANSDIVMAVRGGGAVARLLP